MATPKKKPVVDDVQGVEVSAPAGDITVIFDGEGNSTVGYCLNGQGQTFPAGVAVVVPQYVADLIGKYQIV